MKWVERAEGILFAPLVIFLPTQLGRHFWPEWSFVSGVRVDYLSPTLYLTDILIVGLFVLEFFKAIRSRRQFIIWHFSFAIYLLIALFTYFNIVGSLSPTLTLYKWVKVVELGFLAWWVAKHGLRPRDYWLLLIPVSYEAILVAWQFFSQSSIGGVWYFLGERTFTSSTPGIANAYFNGQLVLRPYGTFPHPNVLGGFLAAALPLILAHFLHNSRRLNARGWVERLGWFGGLGLGYVALGLSLSRAAIVVGVAATLVILGRVLRQKLGWGLAAVLIIAAIFTGPRFLSLGVETESVVARQELVSLAISKWSQSPFIGTGLGTFPVYSRGFLAGRSNYALNFQPVHNIYLLLLAETGIVGFGVFGILIIYLVKKLMTGENYLLLTPLLSILLLGLFDHYFLTLQQGQLLVALVFGLAFCRDAD